VGLEDRKLLTIDLSLTPPIAAIAGQPIGYQPVASSGSGGGIPDGLSQDLGDISQNSNPSVNIELLKWAQLAAYGASGAALPWEQLRPTDFTTYLPSSNTTTAVNNGFTTTLTTDGYATGSSSGSPMASGGGAWDLYYIQHSDYTSKITGPGASGRTFNQGGDGSYDLTWHAWGTGDGVTNYKVTEDIVKDDSNGLKDPAGGSYSNSSGDTSDGHLMAEGQVNSAGILTGSDFTYKGDLGTTFTLADSSGDPSAPGGGYGVDYSASDNVILNDSGSLTPDSTNKGSLTATNSESGSVSMADGTGAFSGASRSDGATVKSTYNAGAQASPPASPSTGTISVSGPKTNLQIPTGKHVVYVIDDGDAGWADWTPKERQEYATKHNIPITSDPVANGMELLAALNQSPTGNFTHACGGLDQVLGDLDKAVATRGQVDVLVLGDHGNPTKGQALGDDDRGRPIFLSPGTSALTNVMSCLKHGGTLVLTGCAVFGIDPDPKSPGPNANISSWQAYATQFDITIIGSVATTGAGNGYYNGVWVTLTPGGTPPTLVP